MHEFGSVVGLWFGNGRPKGRGRQGSAMPKVVRALMTSHNFGAEFATQCRYYVLI